MGIGRNIESFRKQAKLTQGELGEKLHVSNKTISSWEKGRTEPNIGMIEAMCEIFKCEKTDLIDGIFKPQAQSSNQANHKIINVLGRVAAGIPIDSISEIIDQEYITEELAQKGEYFGLRIKGDSMSPVIMDKDTVIVRSQEDAETDEIVIALINGHDGVCKKLKKLDNGLMLISINPQYAPLVFTSAEIDQTPVKIIGKVVEIRRKL